ncbi:MAG: hypothetical protein J5954_09715 [Prevotella sp.]|nr:hypothetical protein [Prevotella sp.]MBP3212569.1 hypothetical protein [Prevotella sp.]
MKQIKHMKQIKNFLLTLCLIVAGAQSAWAYDYVGKYPDSDGNEYYVYAEQGLFGGTLVNFFS